MNILSVSFLLLFVSSHFTSLQSKVLSNCTESNDCLKFFYNSVPPKFLPKGETIGQDWNGKFNKTVFVTIYDKIRKIPIYSAYKLGMNRNLNNSKQHREKKWRTDNDLGNQQAYDKDYRKSGYSRGHLAPNLFFMHNYRSATFSLTNTVPQVIAFNSGPWRQAEERLREMMANNCSTNSSYFITGVVPGNRTLTQGNVNIPDYIYTAACCGNRKIKMEEEKEESQFSFGYIGKNEKVSNVDLMTISELQEMLTKYYQASKIIIKKNITFFKDCGSKENSQSIVDFLKKGNGSGK